MPQCFQRQNMFVFRKEYIVNPFPHKDKRIMTPLQQMTFENMMKNFISPFDSMFSTLIIYCSSSYKEFSHLFKDGIKVRFEKLLYMEKG